MSDPLTQLLTALPIAEPDTARAERLRTSCQARLASQRRPAERHPIPLGAVWQPAIALLGVAYLLEAIAQALGLFGLL